MSKRKKSAGVPNPELARAMMGKRLSSAASPHKDKRTKRNRTRSTQRSRAIAEF